MTWKSTYPQNNKPLTAYDDSIVSVRYRYVVASRMLYKDYCGTAKVANQQLYTIQQQDLTIKSLKKDNESLLKVNHYNDSINRSNETLINNAAIQHAKDNFELARQKGTKIGLGIALPVAVAVSFLAGWFLHVK